MWCHQCGQDVPAISSVSSGGIACARCSARLADTERTPIPTDALHQVANRGLDLGAMPQAQLSGYDDWEIDQSLRRLRARIGSGRKRRKAARPKRRTAAPRVDRAHTNVAAPHRPRARGGVSTLAWALMSLGLMSLVCGGVLLGWSIVEDRPELWTIGLPLAAGGQVGLLVGLVLQLERVWQNSRDAVTKLEAVDSQLDHLERTTALFGVTHSSAAQAFYSHMADEADPEMLLADLKGQLDILSRSMARRH